MPMISVLGKMFLWQREGPGGRWTCQTSRRVASDPAWAVEWIELPRGLSLSSLGSARTLRGWSRSPRPSSVDSQDLPEVNVGDTVAMLPKSRRALTIQEIAALARSSLHGISQVVKDHVTKPTAMAQGRVAHLIEWKGWSKPSDSPAALESAFSSYSDLSEGEQEARFAAGVAEQFAIAEAKLRAWSSVDGDDSTDDSYDEDFTGGADTDRRKETIQADLDTVRTKITRYTQVGKQHLEMEQLFSVGAGPVLCSVRSEPRSSQNKGEPSSGDLVPLPYPMASYIALVSRRICGTLALPL
ncbi:protein FAM131A isoform X3 [Rattus norvegicus]|uniref:protein FAM131A isoform X3 n=1 Tax=Rattus norvegicus TaxID=10116 RepID=UPI001916EBCC|nr:protein FAM131A isoform X3 [Rattus norvegicus]